MRFCRIALCLALLLPGVGVAQQRSPRTDVISKLIHLKYADARRVRGLLISEDIHISADNDLSALVVTGTPAQIKSIEDAVRELDTPNTEQKPNNVELIVYVIGAFAKPVGDSNIPAALQPVITQLKASFPYQNYILLNAIASRSRQGDQTVQNKGSLDWPNETKPEQNMRGSYNLFYRISGVQGHTVHVGSFGMNCSAEGVGFPQAISLSSEFDVPEGQKVVLGKADIASPRGALLLVVSAKIVD